MATKRIQIYIKNPEQFKILQDEVSKLWYEKNGDALSQGDLIEQALRALKKVLEETENGDSRQDIHKYLRLGV